MPAFSSHHDKSSLNWVVALISGAALAYEIVLMRLLSIIQWHHFAYMIISLALLGYGVSGVCLTALREHLDARFQEMFPFSVILFSVSAPLCFWLAQSLPFNPAEIFWSPVQPMYLFALYILLAIPFFFAATAIGLALYRCREQLFGIYAADLAGAGTGTLIAIGLLSVVSPQKALILVSIIPLIGLVPYYLLKQSNMNLGLFACIGLSILLSVIPERWQTLQISPYKELKQTLRIPGTRVIDRFSSPIGSVDVVDSTEIPFRYAPGLSLNANVTFPRQLAVFTDSDNMAAITQYDGRAHSIDYLDQMTSSLPYHLHPTKSALILGAGTGSDLLQAHLFNVEYIDAVELNQQLLDYLRQRQDTFSGGIFSSNSIHFHVGEARGFVAASKRHYDLIGISLLDSFGAASAGLYALSENYLYTIEALQSYIGHLNPNGYLALTRWVKMPPRDTLKLFATAVIALEKNGVVAPDRQLILIRGWQTSTLLIKSGWISQNEIDVLKKYCAERSFDVDYYPDMTESESNRHNILPEPYYFRAAQALLGPNRKDYIERYKFDIRPATDDQPYFFKFFKWSSLPEIVTIFRQGGISLLEGGYVILITGTAQALLASALFISLPLYYRNRAVSLNLFSLANLRWPIYFFCLGLAFLFVEIAFMQKFILFLHHPVYSLAVVLSTFLLSAGMGSRASAVLASKRYGQWYPVIGIAVIALAYLAVLKDLTDYLLHRPPWLNFAVSVLLTAPLGVFMGMLFPLGLTRIGRIEPSWIPWAWGINGFASVISAMLATLIAIHWGFNVLILLAVGLYLLAGVCFQTEKPISLSSGSGHQ